MPLITGFVHFKHTLLSEVRTPGVRIKNLLGKRSIDSNLEEDKNLDSDEYEDVEEDIPIDEDPDPDPEEYESDPILEERQPTRKRHLQLSQ